MDVLSLVDRGFRGHPHDHGSYHDVLAGSREDGRIPLALLDLIIDVACPCPCALGVEVWWARTSTGMMFIGLLGFTSLGSFQALLVVLCLLPKGAWNQIGIILCALYCYCPTIREVQHVALSHRVAAPLGIGFGFHVPRD